MEHTPLPWKVEQPGRSGLAGSSRIVGNLDQNGLTQTCVVQEVYKKENADYIVRAANSYPDLLKAARFVLCEIDEHFNGGSGDEVIPVWYEQALELLVDAIANARP